MLRWQQIRWFFKQVRVLWRWKNKLGLDGNWPTLLLKPYSKHDVVWDDLTGHEVIVNGIQYAEGHIHPEGPNPDHLACWGIYVGSTYLDGARHPWEISPLQ